MAIGIPLPPRQVPRSWREAGTVFTRQTMVLKAGILRALSATRAKDLSEPRGRARQRQRARLIAFERRYESLVDLLCAAAHEGIHPERESEYSNLRAWMLANYPGIAPYVRSQWDASGISIADPFRTLYCHARLEDAINVETGIDDIMLSRNALEAYRNSLDMQIG